MRILLVLGFLGLCACSTDKAASIPAPPTSTKDTGGGGDNGVAGDVVAPDTTATDTAKEDDTGPLPTSCTGAKDGDACDDGNACTTATTCQAGVCAGGSTVVCETDTPCKTSVCVPSTGCMQSALADGADCATPCFGKSTCQAGTCVNDPKSKTVCPAPADPCVDALQCNPASGLCDIPTAKPDDAACDTDGDACSIEACTAGACVKLKDETCDAQ